jgi:hypothetical protein
MNKTFLDKLKLFLPKTIFFKILIELNSFFGPTKSYNFAQKKKTKEKKNNCSADDNFF